LENCIPLFSSYIHLLQVFMKKFTQTNIINYDMEAGGSGALV